MVRLYRWIAVWDKAGLQARENGIANASPASNVEWLLPSSNMEWLTVPLGAAADAQAEGDAKEQQLREIERRRKHSSAIVRPAWEKDSGLAFLMSQLAWGSIHDAEAWASSAEGQRWLDHAKSFTLLAHEA